VSTRIHRGVSGFVGDGESPRNLAFGEFGDESALAVDRPVDVGSPLADEVHGVARVPSRNSTLRISWRRAVPFQQDFEERRGKPGEERMLLRSP
jgi:hypothetical protein